MFIKIARHQTHKFSLLFAISTLTALLVPLFTALPAQAACEYQGQTYQTGDTVGPYVCMPDGSWQPQ